MSIRILSVVFVLASLAACSRSTPDEPVAAVVPPAPVVEATPAPAPPAEPRPLPPDATSLASDDRKYLVGQGLLEPEAELIADLRAHPELIECKGSVGGTPGFHDPEAIHILGRDRAQAMFDDGHEQGSVDLSFTVRGGKIKWDVEKIDCGGDARVANAGKP
jgi:hypothetical protein